MSKSESLLNQYHIAIAKAQDLQEQLNTKQKQWAEQEEKTNITEKLIREFCEDVLAKDPGEMVLGTDYSWSSIPVNELILKAKKVYREYCAKRTDLLRKTMDTSEQRLQEIESLQEQISIMKMSPSSLSITQEELKEKIDREKKEEKATAALPHTMREKVTKGKAAVFLDDGDGINIEQIVLNDMADINAAVQITPKSIPVTPTRKQVEQKRNRKKQKMMAHTVNLKEYEAKMSEYDWAALQVIGDSGVSRYLNIEELFLKAKPDATKNRSRIAMSNLANIGLLNMEKVTNPLKGNFNVYQLTDMGSRIYRDRYNKAPAMSEMDKIMAEHDNCQHGYGIRIVTEVLKEKGTFADVCDTNRKNPIKLADGISYIPDIICTDESGTKMYIEYECANHTQANFNGKCNKMCKVSSILNFIVPNRADMDKLCTQIKTWIQNRGVTSLKHITIRVTGAFQIKDVDLLDDKGWKYVFKPGKNIEPEVNF